VLGFLEMGVLLSNPLQSFAPDNGCEQGHSPVSVTVQFFFLM
jgi:hypothetical protein